MQRVCKASSRQNTQAATRSDADKAALHSVLARKEFSCRNLKRLRRRLVCSDHVLLSIVCFFVSGAGCFKDAEQPRRRGETRILETAGVCAISGASAHVSEVRILTANEMQMQHQISDLEARLNRSESRALRGQRSEKEETGATTTPSPAALIAAALAAAPSSAYEMKLHANPPLTPREATLVARSTQAPRKSVVMPAPLRPQYRTIWPHSAFVALQACAGNARLAVAFRDGLCCQVWSLSNVASDAKWQLIQKVEAGAHCVANKSIILHLGLAS